MKIQKIQFLTKFGGAPRNPKIFPEIFKWWNFSVGSLCKALLSNSRLAVFSEIVPHCRTYKNILYLTFFKKNLSTDCKIMILILPVVSNSKNQCSVHIFRHPCSEPIQFQTQEKKINQLSFLLPKSKEISDSD